MKLTREEVRLIAQDVWDECDPVMPVNDALGRVADRIAAAMVGRYAPELVRRLTDALKREHWNRQPLPQGKIRDCPTCILIHEARAALERE